MPASVRILTPVVVVQPGAEGVGQVEVRNTGTVVDEFAINLVGQAGGWARCDPPVLSLFPGGEQTVLVRFTPPRSSAVVAGAIPFGVRVTCREDAEFSVVEEGLVQVTGFEAVQAKVVPRTSEGKRTAVHRVEVTNTGNAVVRAALSSSDPDGLLVFDLDPDELSVEPGATAAARMKIAALKGHSGSGVRRIPFTVVVEPSGRGRAVQVDGAFEQKPKVSVLVLAAIVVLAAVLVFLIQDQASGL